MDIHYLKLNYGSFNTPCLFTLNKKYNNAHSNALHAYQENMHSKKIFRMKKLETKHYLSKLELKCLLLLSIYLTLAIKICSPYKAKWQLPELIQKAGKNYIKL